MAFDFQRIRGFLKREPPAPSLDLLVSLAAPSDALEIRLNWLVDLVHWVRGRNGEINRPPTQLPSRRLGRFLDVLDRNPEWKKNVARTLRSIIHETQAVDLFSEAGLPRQFGLVHEIGHRLTVRLLPPQPDSTELGGIFDRLFLHHRDDEWVQGLDESVLRRFIQLLEFEVDPAEERWNTLADDVEDALSHLTAQILVSGCSSAIRARLKVREIRELPFFKLNSALLAVFAARRQRAPAALTAELNYLRSLIGDCDRCTREVLEHLEDHGVSTDVVYQLAYLEASLVRLEALLDIAFTPALPLSRISGFVAMLVRENHARRSLTGLLRGSFQLLTRKMVERNAQTGDHYIARTAADYREMLGKGSGGGLIMSLTVWFKTLLFAVELPALIKGFAFAINYSVGFVAIQLAGATLATKQPATTAPALAAGLHRVMDPEEIEAFVDEVASLIRAQFAAIIGNLGLVIPAVIGIHCLVHLVTGGTIFSPARAAATLQSISILGPSWIFAAFTGVLLCASSLFGAWAENWFAYHQLARTLQADRSLKRLLGPTRAGRLAEFLKRNIAGFASNISLAFMLGIVPEFAIFAGLPLDVRHVTLSAGFFAAAVASLGPASLESSPVWLAVAGLAAIAMMNLLVSFSLAMFVAIRARAIDTTGRHAIYRAILKRLNQRPLSFLLPV